jgi:CheY-like chemotaxis protein
VAPAATTPPPAPAAARPPGGRGRILLVEDNAINQMVAVALVEQLGYDVTVAADGIDALTSLAQHTYDAVLMDCQMPRMDGYEATAEIRRREGEAALIGAGESGGRTPIIALTASAMASERDHCIAVGMDDHLPKPVRREALAAKLERWVGQPAADPPERSAQTAGR